MVVWPLQGKEHVFVVGQDEFLSAVWLRIGLGSGDTEDTKRKGKTPAGVMVAKRD